MDKHRVTIGLWLLGAYEPQLSLGHIHRICRLGLGEATRKGEGASP